MSIVSLLQITLFKPIYKSQSTKYESLTKKRGNLRFFDSRALSPLNNIHIQW